MSDSFDLAANGVASFPHAPAGTTFTCLAGRVWITVAGDSRDHLLAPGATLTLERAGHAVAQALAPSRLEVSRPAPVYADPTAWRRRDRVGA